MKSESILGNLVKRDEFPGKLGDKSITSEAIPSGRAKISLKDVGRK